MHRSRRVACPRCCEGMASQARRLDVDAGGVNQSRPAEAGAQSLCSRQHRVSVAPCLSLPGPWLLSASGPPALCPAHLLISDVVRVEGERLLHGHCRQQLGEVVLWEAQRQKALREEGFQHCEKARSSQTPRKVFRAAAHAQHACPSLHPGRERGAYGKTVSPSCRTWITSRMMPADRNQGGESACSEVSAGRRCQVTVAHAVADW